MLSISIEIKSWIEQQDLSQPLELGSLAKKLNLSLSRVRHIFKEVTGLSLNRYIKSCRLQMARRLLTETHLSVKEIRSVVGIGDHSHFGRDYRRMFGETPMQTRSRAFIVYRQQCKPLISQSGHSLDIDATEQPG